MHPMHWENQPRWRRPDEVTEQGLYVFTLVDDDEFCITIRIDDDFCGWDGLRSVHGSSPVTTWDDECRFFGPIPEREK